ncbi:MFS transporter [Nocardia blacklockiae]|uniref:MFS transporter n=1 Tax=Nocardia blacklockiae TaxID=480036 RepID=UPI00189633BD|nr:MFS transporter [Nocardia blacklockiae]MBF6175808.1 MFS transporter [Nocardia blacklockiae]
MVRPTRAGILLAVVSAAIFFDALDLSITQIALPSIQESLRLSASTLPWVAAGYVVTYGGFLLLGGRAGDLLGARRVFLAGLAIFGAASLACGLAGGATVLIAARAVQGVGAALTVPAAVTVLATAFTEERARNRAFGVFAAAASSGFGIGLVLGGLLTSGLSWRWIFLAKVPAVALVLLAALRAVPGRVDRERSRGAYDLAGAIAGTGGAVLLTYGVTRAGNPGTAAVDIALPLAGAVVLIGLFVLVERRSRMPLLPLRLLTQAGLTPTNLGTLTVLAAPFGVSFVVTVYVQDVLRRSPWDTALVLLPGAMLSAVVARYLAPFLLDRLGLRVSYAIGLTTVAAGDAILLALTEATWIWVVIVATIISFGLGMGLAYPSATMGGVRGVAPNDQGAAAGLNNTALQIGGALGLAIVATAVNIGAGGQSLTHLGPDAAQLSVRYGAAAAIILPLLGALVVVFGLARIDRRE